MYLSFQIRIWKDKYTILGFSTTCLNFPNQISLCSVLNNAHIRTRFRCLCYGPFCVVSVIVPSVGKRRMGIYSNFCVNCARKFVSFKMEITVKLLVQFRFKPLTIPTVTLQTIHDHPWQSEGNNFLLPSIFPLVRVGLWLYIKEHNRWQQQSPLWI